VGIAVLPQRFQSWDFGRLIVQANPISRHGADCPCAGASAATSFLLVGEAYPHTSDATHWHLSSISRSSRPTAIGLFVFGDFSRVHDVESVWPIHPGVWHYNFSTVKGRPIHSAPRRKTWGRTAHACAFRYRRPVWGWCGARCWRVRARRDILCACQKRFSAS